MATGLTTQFVKLKIDSTTYCIKSFPDIDPHGNPDQVEITDLCSTFHEYMDGLKNYADDLEFTANYDEAIFNTLNGYGTTQKAVEILLCSGSSDTTGANGKFTISSAEIAVRLSGAGVGDALEMIIIVKPRADVVFASVS